jgi:hypothetical protein
MRGLVTRCGRGEICSDGFLLSECPNLLAYRARLRLNHLGERYAGTREQES